MARNVRITGERPALLDFKVAQLEKVLQLAKGMEIKNYRDYLSLHFLNEDLRIILYGKKSIRLQGLKRSFDRYAETNNPDVWFEPTEEESEGHKDRFKTIQEGVMLLQELTSKMLDLGKSTSTNIGSVWLALDGFKQEGIKLFTRVFTCIDSLMSQENSSNDDLAISVHNS